MRHLTKNRMPLPILFILLLLTQYGFSQDVDQRSSYPALNIKYPKHLKIDHALFKLWQIYRTQGIEKAREYAQYKPSVNLSDHRVRVEVLAALPSVKTQSLPSRGLAYHITAMGGKVELRHRSIYQCLIPLAVVNDVANMAQVAYIKLPLKAQLHTISEGVKFSGADKLQPLSPFRKGRTARVGVLDLGFQDYQTLLGSELPSDTEARSFRQDGDLTGGGISHGSACAEIVHDMAPDAKIYLANFNTLYEIYSALSWFESQDVNIITCSIGWYNAGAGDGTGPITEAVKQAKNLGMQWVNSAGNDAMTHWEGLFSDSNKDGYMDFGSDDIFEFKMPAYQPVQVLMNWDDWGTWNGSSYPGSSNDYDLYLYYYDTTAQDWVQVDSSENPQNGIPGHWPVESITDWSKSKTTTWGVKIKRNAGAQNKKIELFFDFNYTYDMEFTVSEGSLTIPADSADVVAVGAIPWEEGYKDYYYPYSGRGPTADGRLKPDLTAASGVSNQTYGTFYGTSASAPHAAGAMALLYNKTPFSLEQIVELLFARADDWGQLGQDLIFGIGKLDLDE